MLKSHEKFHSANGRRQVLVADDEMINRAILGNLLETEYEVLYAADGREALEVMRANRGTLSLVLLDLQMPEVSGMEVLRAVRDDPELERIPVIVLTSDQSAEIESLSLGAIDFIPKPYPQPGVILARVLRTIELSEDRQIIQSTERDPLTGLYNREYFYRYAEQFDQHHRDLETDAIVVDINHFHMLNERYGKAYGDEVLRRVGEGMRQMVGQSGGIVCRREADTFMIYCPHREDYRALLEAASVGLASEDGANNRVRLRMGVYSRADKSIDIERRFDRAKLASDTVRSSFTRNIALYDDALHEAQLYAEQLIEDFHEAIEGRQFVVYYQPKFDIRSEIPVLASAEALVRWKHPRLGMISPGVFIPLFEENGLIQALDLYVWRAAAAQIRQWRDRFGISVPVSVNVSRVDMYDPNLIETFQDILASQGLTSREFLLEITESAYTEDSAQIISTVERLRELGFQIEMDDFGTGYSSLNMISSLPIDALKLDMRFIREAFRGEKDTRLIEVIIDIADYLSVPVIAEGVETEEQLQALKAMGCDLVQGYYFSKPVPPEEYERFVVERRQLELDDAIPDRPGTRLPAQERELAYTSIAHALTTGFESIYYVDADTGMYVQFSTQGRYEDLQIERSGQDFFADTQRNLLRVVYPADRERVSLSLRRDALLDQLMGGGHFTMTYRLLIDDRPAYYSLRAVHAPGRDGYFIVIGVSNVEEQLQQAMGSDVAQARSRAFLSIAQALSSDFESVYYIDSQTGEFTEYTTQGAYEALRIKMSGDDFFAECRRNVDEVVAPEDRERVKRAMDREALLDALSEGRPLSLNYRLMIDGAPTEYGLKAVRLEEDSRHIVIGVANIELQMRRQREYEAAKAEKVTFSRIAQALAADYFSIYYVDSETDRFIEYSAHEDYGELDIEKGGGDFFTVSRRNIERVVYPGDREKVLMAFTKENLMSELEQTGTFTLTYRLMFGGVPTFVNLKASRMADASDKHIVIGVSNVDAQMKRELELNAAREKANRDALTGVKSKHAYIETEAALDAQLAAGEAPPFAVAVCDVNGLKRVNDTQGHKFGDQLIRDASAIICNIFKHSPVFRTGGDEFVALLRGQDFERREALMSEMAARNRANLESGGPIIASGLAVFDPALDDRLSAVFERADLQMYEDKKELKARAGL